MQTHPVIAILKKVYQSEIRYCPICCPEKVDHKHSALDIARAELKMRRKIKVMCYRETNTDTQYREFLIHELEFYGTRYNEYDDIYELEQLYSQLI